MVSCGEVDLVLTSEPMELSDAKASVLGTASKPPAAVMVGAALKSDVVSVVVSRINQSPFAMSTNAEAVLSMPQVLLPFLSAFAQAR